jgi:hypothetical protein
VCGTGAAEYEIVTPIPSTTVPQLLIGAALIIAVVVLAIFRPGLYAAAVLVGLAASLVIAVGLITSILIYIAGFRRRGFGLIPGTTTRRQRSLLDVMAGIPKPTVEKSLVPWLNDCLNALAGLPAEHVLRFGHLWSGLEFHEQRLMASPRDVASWRQMSKDPDLRLDNLELMTTDVTRGRPFRFPLEPIEDDDSEQLWVCVDELRDGESPLFPESVLTALRQTESKKVQDRHGGERLRHKLPQPCDLPVIFAVRISMSLPALFQAIRMYQIRKPSPVQDDLGHAIEDRGKPLILFDPLESAQELWFSDGGITSNFPVHFFDNPLPRWPTVSLNLGIHPRRTSSRHLAAAGLGLSEYSGQDARRLGARVRASDFQHCHVMAGQPAVGPAGIPQPHRSSPDKCGRGRDQSVHAAGDHRVLGPERCLGGCATPYQVHR